MNATRLGIVAFAAASAVFAVAMYLMLARANEDAITEVPDFSGLDLQGGERVRLDSFDDLFGPPRTVTFDTTAVSPSGERTVTITKRYQSGSTTRIDTLDTDGSVATSRIRDGSVIDCDWTEKTCRKVRDTSLSRLPELLRTRRAEATTTPPPDSSLIGMLPTARVTTSERLVLGEPATCTLSESPYGDSETCSTADRIVLYERRLINGTTTTTVATELLRFIPYEAIGLPFPLEDDDE